MIAAVQQARQGMAMNKQEVAYQILRQRIVSGVYGPGYRLIIDELARELQMSQTPLREAVRRLEAEGLVEYVRNAGARVVTIDERQYLDVLSTLAVLEGYATALAAPCMTPRDVAILRAFEDDMAAAVDAGDMLRYGALNRAYHEAIYAHCPNRYLVGQIERAWTQLDSMRQSIFVLLPTRARASLDDHRRITQLIAERAPAEEIERVVRQHKLATADAFHAWTLAQRAPRREAGHGVVAVDGHDQHADREEERRRIG